MTAVRLLWAVFAISIFNLPTKSDSRQMQTHTKWLFGLIITSILISLLLFSVAMIDSFGIYSIYSSPAVCIVTVVFHSVSLPVWRNTYKERRGQPKTTSIYSVVSAVLTCLLAVLWVALASTYTVVIILEGSSYIHISVPMVETALAWVGTFVLWAEFAIQVHYRKQFHRLNNRYQFRDQQWQQNPGDFPPKVEGAFDQELYSQRESGPWNYQQYPQLNPYYNYTTPLPSNQQGQVPYAGGMRVTSFIERSGS